MSSNPCTAERSFSRTTPPRGLAGAGCVIPPEYFFPIPLSISFQCKGRSEGCFPRALLSLASFCPRCEVFFKARGALGVGGNPFFVRVYVPPPRRLSSVSQRQLSPVDICCIC